ncbi:alpha/beta hydrolase [Paenibacillus sambharensis]|uniref:Alpha/beta hydrolase n=1 Tax=Paenibacillus sambharensis TaxID=1803190 RepID=A0A2W1LL25_9BACL|nr:alpha/beta hydrolase [Paenibacillus sambharensis]PZD95662.1 alpha/beta hydrolase [Paenibacillus sambharensis]
MQAIQLDTIKLAMSDGIELHATHYSPADREVAGAICLLHGMGEHGGRYEELAGRLAGQGYAILAPDQRGHGRTPGKRGHAESVLRLAEDAARTIEYTQAIYEGLPVFLYGHSMGGNVALSCALRYRPAITGLVLSSPWLKLGFDPPRHKVMLGQVLARLLPSLTLATQLEAGALYRNDNQIKKDWEDKLLHNRISAALYFSLTEEGRRSISYMADLKVPLLHLHGTADTVTSYAASREAAERVKGECQFVALEGGFHELHHDREKERFTSILIEWLNRLVQLTNRAG